MFCIFTEGRKSVYYSHFDFLADWELRKKNAGIRLKQKQCIIANAIILTPNYDMTKQNLKDKK